MNLIVYKNTCGELVEPSTRAHPNPIAGGEGGNHILILGEENF